MAYHNNICCIKANQNKRSKYIIILLFLFFIIIILSSCLFNSLYYEMDNFTDDQVSKIKTYFNIDEEINLNIISLTTESFINEPRAVLVFMVDENSDDTFNNNLPLGLSWNKYPTEINISYNGVLYYLSKEAVNGYNNCLKYLPKNGVGNIIYTCTWTDYDQDLYNMTKKYGKTVDDFPSYYDSSW